MYQPTYSVCWCACVCVGTGMEIIIICCPCPFWHGLNSLLRPNRSNNWISFYSWMALLIPIILGNVPGSVFVSPEITIRLVKTTNPKNTTFTQGCEEQNYGRKIQLSVLLPPILTGFQVKYYFTYSFEHNSTMAKHVFMEDCKWMAYCMYASEIHLQLVHKSFSFHPSNLWRFCHLLAIVEDTNPQCYTAEWTRNSTFAKQPSQPHNDECTHTQMSTFCTEL